MSIHLIQNQNNINLITGNGIGFNDLTYVISLRSQIIEIPSQSQLTATLNAELKTIQDILAR